MSDNPYPVPGERVQGIWDMAPHGAVTAVRFSPKHHRGITVVDVDWDDGSKSYNLDIEMIEKESEHEQ